MVRLALIALLAANLGAARRPGPDFQEPARPATSVEPAAPSLRVLLLGDFGDPTPQQRRVSSAFLRWHAARPFDLALQPGDNVYGCGPNPRLPFAAACRFAADGVSLEPGVAAPADPLYEKNEAPLRALLGQDGNPIPIYLALGNHDVGAADFCRAEGLSRDEWMRRRACLEVAHRTPTWRMPARHYVLDQGPVRFIVVDSNVAWADYGGFTLAAEAAFVRESSAPCRDRLCFLVAHHTPAMAVDRTPPPGFEPSLQGMRTLVAAAGGRLAAVLTGHVHALEHLSYGDVDVLITGAGARPGRYVFRHGWPADSRLHFASNAGGFGVLEAWTGGWKFQLVNDQGRAVHCCEAAGHGRCRPVACAAPGKG